MCVGARRVSCSTDSGNRVARHDILSVQVEQLVAVHEQDNVVLADKAYDDPATFVAASPCFGVEGSEDAGSLTACDINAVVFSLCGCRLFVIEFRNVGDAVRDDGCPVFPGGSDGVCGCGALDFVWTRKPDCCSFGRNIQVAFFPRGDFESVVFKRLGDVILDHLFVCDDCVESSDGVTGDSLHAFVSVEGVFEGGGNGKQVPFLYAVAEVRIAAVNVCDKEEWGDNCDDQQQWETVAYDSRESIERVFDEDGYLMELLYDLGQFFRVLLEIQGERFLGGGGVSADGLASFGVFAPCGAFFG